MPENLQNNLYLLGVIKMGVFDKLKKKNKEAGSASKQIREFDKIQFRKIVDEFKKETAIPSLKMMTIKDEKPSITSSKLGGNPYLPKGFEYPRNSDGELLRLLAQLNFSELPKLENFPMEGILQFYILDDDCYGVENFGNYSKQNNYRIVYHQEILPLDMLQTDFSFLEQSSDEEDYFVLQEEFKLTGELINQHMVVGDYRFYRTFAEICQKYGVSNYMDYNSDNFIENIYDDMYEELSLEQGTHLVNGYPAFAQVDPREDCASLEKFDTLLFQLDSEYNAETENWDIIWGDAGVGNFFINVEDLKNCNFDKVLYNYDCH